MKSKEKKPSNIKCCPIREESHNHQILQNSGRTWTQTLFNDSAGNGSSGKRSILSKTLRIPRTTTTKARSRGLSSMSLSSSETAAAPEAGRKVAAVAPRPTKAPGPGSEQQILQAKKLGTVGTIVEDSASSYVVVESSL